MATNDNKKYYWLKLYANFFEKDEIQIIEDMDNGKDYIIFYLKLLCKSISSEGILKFSEAIPYNDKMLSTITKTNIDIVRSAIKIFTNLKMMSILDDGSYYMEKVQNMIGLETGAAQRMRKSREIKLLEKNNKQIGNNVPNLFPNVPNLFPNVPNCSQEIEIELDSTNNTKDNTPSGTEGFTYLNKNIAVAKNVDNSKNQNVDNFQLMKKISYLLEELKVDKSEWNKILTFPEDQIKKYVAAVKEKMKQNKCENPAGLFLYLLYNNKDVSIKYEETQKKQELQLYKKKASKFCLSCTEWESRDIFCSRDGMRLDKNTLCNVKCEFCEVENE